jgi:hypothetical protein
MFIARNGFEHAQYRLKKHFVIKRSCNMPSFNDSKVPIHMFIQQKCIEGSSAYYIVVILSLSNYSANNIKRIVPRSF